MRISDWSSDVCSCDLVILTGGNPITQVVDPGARTITNITQGGHRYHSGTVEISITPTWYGSAVILIRSEEHTSELQSLMRTSYAVFCLKKNKKAGTTYMKTYRAANQHMQLTRRRNIPPLHRITSTLT